MGKGGFSGAAAACNRVAVSRATAFGKVLVRMLDHMATGEDQERAGCSPFTSRHGSTEALKLRS